MNYHSKTHQFPVPVDKVLQHETREYRTFIALWHRYNTLYTIGTSYMSPRELSGVNPTTARAADGSRYLTLYQKYVWFPHCSMANCREYRCGNPEVTWRSRVNDNSFITLRNPITLNVHTTTVFSTFNPANILYNILMTYIHTV